MSWNRKNFKTIALVWWCGLTAVLASPSADFRVANRFYDAGKFAEAATAYEAITPKTAHVYFNLGNACFRQDKIGHAILNYERARRLAPRDPDILANLKFAQQRLLVDEVNTPASALRRFVDNVLASRTIDEWAGYELVGLWLTVLAVAGWVWWPKLRTGFMVGALAAAGVLLVMSVALGLRYYSDWVMPPAIVLSAKTEARFAPLPDATVHFQVAEGTRVVIREDRGQWLFVERADGQQGWVKADGVERVAQPLL